MVGTSLILARMALLILFAAGMSACVLEDPLGPESPPVDSPLLGRWRLESRLEQYGQFWNIPERRTETRIVGQCDMVGELSVTEVRPSGALSWTLRRSATCTPSDTVFEAERSYTDTWERTAWGQVQEGQVRFITPWPAERNGVTDHACWFTGVLTLDRAGRRMSGSVRCHHPLLPSSQWTGEWSAVPVGLSGP